MTEENLTGEQQSFLAACEVEFKDRYTQADKAFMQVCKIQANVALLPVGFM
jgi:hypothetical protein